MTHLIIPSRIMGPRFRTSALDPAFVLGFADLGAGAVSTGAEPTSVAPTFTRATTATTVDSAGLIVSVASGTPRSYYNPTSLAYLGYLAEGARTNLCLQSEVLGTTWTVTGATLSSNAATAPDGATTADSLTGVSTAADGVYQSFTLSAATVYSISVFVKTLDSGRSGVGLYDFTGADFQGFLVFDWTAGVPSTQSDTGCSNVTYTEFPNGWYRISFSATTDAVNTAHRVYFYTDRLNAQKTAYFWGAQLEAAAFASSYIPTTTVAVTRNADVLTYPTAAWLNASAGTLYAQGQVFNIGSSGGVVSLSDGTTAERIVFLQSTVSGNLTVIDGNVVQVGITNGTIAANTTFSMAAGYAANDFSLSVSGATPGTDTSGTLPTVDQIQIGTTGAGTTQPYGPIRRVAYYASRLPDATLQALTA